MIVVVTPSTIRKWQGELAILNLTHSPGLSVSVTRACWLVDKSPDRYPSSKTDLSINPMLGAGVV